MIDKPTGALAEQHAAWRAARARLGKPLVDVRQVPLRLPMPVAEPAPEPDFGPVPIDFYAPPSMKFILRFISLKRGLSMEEILSSTRNLRVMNVRHEAIFMVHTHTLRSYPDIGVFFGRRDHTTMMHSASTFLRKNPDKAWLKEASIADFASRIL